MDTMTLRLQEGNCDVPTA
ncbi:hypothetical protein TGRUB_226330B [Toxoplasma gondii RUB]|uniref:Uncharacterized protein n=4 Tax=Toxoplasma gondii TaxID=5811 RepID=A0A086LW72_TOXGO|nr:hypothetical protein TGRUB_226330B [Toxoplasma gondii RUB]KFH13112.1 hypothetical protein TGVAND_226330B [Toxoplasma gondii VAND]KYF43277.1 hypothetical protein TGARI_226330B [Toxoplasma gondii ARI]